ncbi:MAG: ABC transporter substrate-binding protein [Zhenhengia sp.]|uniref:ABC transporter substrate-binding protein n=1 Tax=Zhenhengia sp. TaxID=2944208 RepID=UPI00290DF591|nr:ABC transporter substrate-binding protein [Clostridiales bacterium]MDU6854983.1 MqnA/MqnD/SBP family protein [Clostridiales bacterium]MDU6974807.1 MqnA/MqnD/SBP family protein [Clostridiales bacterium]
MKKAKKIFAVLSLMSAVLLGGCATKPVEPLEVAALNGPTGIGMVQMLEEMEGAENPKYNIVLYQSPDEIVGKVVSGELDIACVPSNLGAVLYNKTEGGIKLLGMNTLGVLYIVENGQTVQNIEDLKGKTILSSGKDSTPEFVLNYILNEAGLVPGEDVTVEFMGNHSDIASKLMAEEGTIALLPEPFVTTVLAKDENIRMAIDVNEAWNNLNQMDLPMGIIVANANVVKDNAKGIEAFLEDYEASVKFVDENLEDAAALVEKFGIVPNAALAKVAIPKCNIVYRDSSDSEDSLNKFYEILEQANPKAVGGKLPDEAFYTLQ